MIPQLLFFKNIAVALRRLSTVGAAEVSRPSTLRRTSRNQAARHGAALVVGRVAGPPTLKWAAEDRVALSAALMRITALPATVLGVQAGELAVGSVAEICVFDPECYGRVETGQLKSQGKNTPFLGLEVPGKVRITLVAGQVVHRSATPLHGPR